MMKHHIVKALASMLVVAGSSLYGNETAKPTPDEVKALGTRVADWQLAKDKKNSKIRGMTGWVRGAMYVGMWEFSNIVEDDKYVTYLKAIGESQNWKLGRRLYHADDHAVGQAYLNLHRRFLDQSMLKPTRETFDKILENREKGILKRGPKDNVRNRWWWCDALFMAPPVWARLAKITGETKYLDFMDEEYKFTYDRLWDKEENLFWRDTGYIKKREKNGKKIFWARGNGWVIGGLALMIPDLPKDWKRREFYVELFKKMSAKLKDIQRPDGTWSMGLLGSVKDYPTVEASGTAFNTYALAWGINSGILDRATYEPVVLKAWEALGKCVKDDGFLGYVQPVGAGPGKSGPDMTQAYGVGAFLAASAEVYKLVGGIVPASKPAATDKPAAEPEAKAAPTAPDASPCFARFVPERMDDFAWENDRIAFRMYGPALWKIPKEQCGPGVDVWVKKVRYPIINKWYKSGKYHKDTGEGADLYKVGKSLGCGGVGVWAGDALNFGGHFVSHKVITGNGNAIEFELTYAPVTVGGVSVTEVKRISMATGSNLFTSKSTFAVKGAESATIAIGIVLRGHKGDLQHGDNWMSYAEPSNKKNGTTFCAVVLPQKGEFKKANNHGLLLVPVKDGQAITYQAGAAWSKGLDFKTHDEWLKYVKKQAGK